MIDFIKYTKENNCPICNKSFYLPCWDNVTKLEYNINCKSFNENSYNEKITACFQVVGFNRTDIWLYINTDKYFISIDPKKNSMTVFAGNYFGDNKILEEYKITTDNFLLKSKDQINATIGKIILLK